MYTLYHANGACSFAIKAALELANADYTTKLVDLSAGEHKKADYLSINPFGKVPALDVGERVMSEGMAIHLYLSQKYPQAGLFPEDIEQRSEAYRWLSFIYSNLHTHYARLFSPERYGDNEAVVREKAAELLFQECEHVNKQLKNNDYIAGSELSAGDLYLMVQLHWAKKLQLGLDKRFEFIALYMERMYRHPKVGQLYKEEYSVQ